MVTANWNENGFIHATRTHFRSTVCPQAICAYWQQMKCNICIRFGDHSNIKLINVLCLSNWLHKLINDHLFSLNRETRIAPLLVCILKLQIPCFFCFKEAFLASFAKVIFVIPVILAVAEKTEEKDRSSRLGLIRIWCENQRSPRTARAKAKKCIINHTIIMKHAMTQVKSLKNLRNG